MHELLSKNSLFVGQLYRDKSLMLHARDLIFFTTNLQIEIFFLNNSLLELIYFLSIDPDEMSHNVASHIDLHNLLG